MSGNESAAFCLSSVIHVALIVGLLAIGFFGGCLNPKKELSPDEIPVEFLVVTEENAADKLSEEPNDAAEPEVTPPEPEPLPPPPPPEPPKEVVPPPTPVEKVVEPLPPPPPPPVEKKVEPKPEKKVEEKKPEKKPEPKTPEKKKEEVKKPEKKKPVPIKKGTRYGPVTTGKKDRTKAATQKAPSEAEIRKLLAQGAKAGNKTQIPKNEAQRGLGLVKSAFQSKCNDAGLELSPTGKNPTLKVTFIKGGRVTKIVIAESSGDRSFDNKVLMVCRQVKRVSGLSDSFIEQFNPVEIELQ